jgi:hypothetical protein
LGLLASGFPLLHGFLQARGHLAWGLWGVRLSLCERLFSRGDGFGGGTLLGG